MRHVQIPHIPDLTEPELLQKHNLPPPNGELQYWPKTEMLNVSCLNGQTPNSLYEPSIFLVDANCRVVFIKYIYISSQKSRK